MFCINPYTATATEDEYKSAYNSSYRRHSRSKSTTVHYNVKFNSGGLLTRLTRREVYGLKPREIEWIYLVESKRNATQEEIRELCKRPG